MRFKDLKQELVEGVYDPGIFKAFFLAGGAGSGKSYSAEKATGSAAGKFQWHEKMEDNLTPGKVGPYGLKVVNSDEQLEYGLLKAKMSSNMKAYTDDETTKKELIRAKAKKITAKREQLWVNGRLGLIIDGTAKDPKKLSIKKKKLEDVGYDTYMIFVNTSLEKCEERDVKGLYALARNGLIKEFTGISDPYEEPENAEIVINSSGVSPERLVDEIFEKIKTLGYL